MKQIIMSHNFKCFMEQMSIHVVKFVATKNTSLTLTFLMNGDDLTPLVTPPARPHRVRNFVNTN